MEPNPTPLHSGVGTGRYVKRHIGDPMSMWEHYLTRAAELHARARMESNEMAQREYENLAKQFLRLAEQAKHSASVPPRVKISRQS